MSDNKLLIAVTDLDESLYLSSEQDCYHLTSFKSLGLKVWSVKQVYSRIIIKILTITSLKP